MDVRRPYKNGDEIRKWVCTAGKKKKKKKGCKRTRNGFSLAGESNKVNVRN